MIINRGIFGGISLTGKDKDWLLKYLKEVRDHSKIKEHLIKGRKVLDNMNNLYI